MEIWVTVEIPKFSRQKYEFDEKMRVIKLDRTLFSPVYFPFEYGSLRNTKSGDGDPLDVVLLSRFPTFPGCYVKARPIGVLLMEDEAGGDNKIIAVPTEDIDPSFKEIKDVKDLKSHEKKEIKEFFEIYKRLERGKWVNVKEFLSREKAEKMVKVAEAMFGKEKNR
ncbi:MAG: inorganic diphosphatase [Patescibacteria group bacterium]